MVKTYRANKIKSVLNMGLLATGLLLNNPAQAKFLYSVMDLGTFGGDSSHFSRGMGINASGQVTGIAQTPDGGSQHAFVTDSKGQMIDLGTLGGNISVGVSINDKGQVTGYSQTANGSYHAFITNNNGQMIDLGTLGGNNSFGAAINNSGQVTGFSDIVNEMGFSRRRAFTTDSSGQLVDLGTLGDGYYSIGNDLNASGQVTGTSSVNYNGTFGSDTVYHGFVTNSSGAMIDLGALGGSSAGNAINDAGQVTGSVQIDAIFNINHAFVTDSNRQIIDLDPLAEKYSSVGRDINNSGQVIGQYQEKVVVFEYGRGGEIIGQHIEGGETRNFVTVDGAIVDIDALLFANATGWSLHGTPGVDYAEVTAINDAGQITGYANHNGIQRAFLLTPLAVPVPAAVWLFASGLIGMLGCRRKCIMISYICAYIFQQSHALP